MLILAHRSGADIPYKKAYGKFLDELASLEKGSKTARDIISFVTKSTVRICVLAVKTKKQKGPTGKFGPFNMHYAFDGPCIIWDPDKDFQCHAVKSEQITGFYASGNLKWAGKKVNTSFPPMITLIHEIGHAKQYIEDPGQFASKAPGGAISAGTRTIAEIEADNLKRHENPVCKELGFLLRIQYDDLSL